MPDDNTPYALVVEDDVLVRLGACDILADAGFRCLDAADASEAKDCLREHGGQIALLFTDVDLGSGPSGFDLARFTAERLPDVNILVASGARVPRDGDLPDGAVFIRKPFSAEVVYDRLQELLPEGAKPEPLKRKAAS